MPVRAPMKLYEPPMSAQVQVTPRAVRNILAGRVQATPWKLIEGAKKLVEARFYYPHDRDGKLALADVVTLARALPLRRMD